MKRLLVFVFALTLLGSCAKEEQELLSIDPELVGTWEHDDNDRILFFYSNGYSWSVHAQHYQYSAENNTILMGQEVWGYSISGNKLTISCITNPNPTPTNGTYTKQ